MKIRRNVTIGFYIYLLFTLAVSLAEIFVLPNAEQLPDSRVLLFVLVLLIVLLKAANIQPIHDGIHKLNCVFLPVLFSGALFLLYQEAVYGGNFVYLNYGLSYSRVVYLVLASSAFVLMGSQTKKSVSLVKRTVFILPLYLIMAGLMIFVRNHQLFRFLIAEDSVVEYLQTMLFFFSSGISFVLARHWFSKSKLLSVLFFTAALGFFVVAGEEVSWGQRLLGIDTPDHIAATNLQNEINIHNNEKYFGYVYRGYMLIGLMGSIAWLILRLIRDQISSQSHALLRNLTPSWYLSGYFLVAFLYNLDRIYLRPRSGETLWEEPMELLLAMGIFFFFIAKLLTTRKVSHSDD